MKRLALILMIMLLCLSSCAAEESIRMPDGTEIPLTEMTEFYYTHATSTFPPHYQRYHFFVRDGAYYFEHETREGDHFPLRETDATVSGQLELTKEDWKQLLNYLKDGIVERRGEHLDDGDAGPWLYLYWQGDQGVYQEFSFASWGIEIEFEEYCEELRNRDMAVREMRDAFVRTVPTLVIEANGKVFYAALEDNPSAQALIEKLNSGDIEVDMHDYGSFEKVGPLPWSLPRNDAPITTSPGDVILYQGNQITIYYDQNTWDLTRLAKIEGVTRASLLDAFGEGNVTVSFWLEWSE